MMLPFRFGLLLLGFFLLSLRRTSAFGSTKISRQTKTRELYFLQMATSGTNDCSAENPSQVKYEQQQTPKQPRAAVSVALRCFCGDSSDPKAHYLLIQRGNPPNKGKWALPGGKLEWGEKSLEGAKRELCEEVIFDFEDANGIQRKPEIVWSPEPYAVADAIAEGFHYLIAVCFAECKLPKDKNGKDQMLLDPPRVTASDDATDARWWAMDEILNMKDNELLGSPGFIRRMKQTEFLYQQGILTKDEPI